MKTRSEMISLNSSQNVKCFTAVHKNHIHTFYVQQSPPPSGNRVVSEIMWKKYGKARQVTDDYTKTAHARCTPDN
jgi:hypothetical protein